MTETKRTPHNRAAGRAGKYLRRLREIATQDDTLFFRLSPCVAIQRLKGSQHASGSGGFAWMSRGKGHFDSRLAVGGQGQQAAQQALKHFKHPDNLLLRTAEPVAVVVAHGTQARVGLVNDPGHRF